MTPPYIELTFLYRIHMEPPRPRNLNEINETRVRTRTHTHTRTITSLKAVLLRPLGSD